MSPSANTALARILDQQDQRLLQDWLKEQKVALTSGQLEDKELSDQSLRFVAGLREGVASGNENILAEAWTPARAVLEEVSRTRAGKGFSPTETATFVFSLKSPLFGLLGKELGGNAEALATEIWTVTKLLDTLGLYTMEVFQRSREDVIARQQEELLELSTPVVQLWKGVLALPLIGTLDSARTQVVMENLLEEIVKTGAAIAIIDITGVPTVDTLVAQHLLKTISAARLMGADCLISGIRPQIAQTIVHLGVELNVISKATMADAFALALTRIGKDVVDRAGAKPRAERAAE